MLNNCKGKGRKGLHFSQQKGKIRKNSRVDIFIRQYLDIAGTDVGQYCQCGGGDGERDRPGVQTRLS